MESTNATDGSIQPASSVATVRINVNDNIDVFLFPFTELENKRLADNNIAVGIVETATTIHSVICIPIDHGTN